MNTDMGYEITSKTDSAPAVDRAAHGSDFEPDIIDLQSWLCVADDAELAAVWQATKYLSSPYDIWLSAWRNAGSPDITMPAQ